MKNFPQIYPNRTHFRFCRIYLVFPRIEIWEGAMVKSVMYLKYPQPNLMIFILPTCFLPNQNHQHIIITQIWISTPQTCKDSSELKSSYTFSKQRQRKSTWTSMINSKSNLIGIRLSNRTSLQLRLHGLTGLRERIAKFCHQKSPKNHLEISGNNKD